MNFILMFNGCSTTGNSVKQFSQKSILIGEQSPAVDQSPFDPHVNVCDIFGLPWVDDAFNQYPSSHSIGTLVL
jgi:hypothetical protein